MLRGSSLRRLLGVYEDGSNTNRKNEVCQADLFGRGVVRTKDASDQGVQIGAEGSDFVEASLSGRCPDLSNVRRQPRMLVANQRTWRCESANKSLRIGGTAAI